MSQPRISDAFGDLLRATWRELAGEPGRVTLAGGLPQSVPEIVERDDGFISASPAAGYFSTPEQWQPFDRRALDRLGASTLDVGVGAGRLALALQDRGVAVTGLDTSAGACEVSSARGVRATVCATVYEHARGEARYDRFALLGNNLGLLESRERAPEFLAALARLARPGAEVVGQGTDPYATSDPVHLGYQHRNRAAGRMAGQLRLRVRHRDASTPWFDYLLCTPDELAELVHGSSWRLSDVDTADAPHYIARLTLAGP